MFETAVGILAGWWRQPSGSRFTRQMPFPGEAPAINSGFSRLNKAIGLKGLPQSHITELIGVNSWGVWSIAARIAAQFQRRQLPVGLIDMAHRFDGEYVTRCGVTTSWLLRYTPVSAFQLVRVMEHLARQTGLVVFDLGFVPKTLAGADAVLLAALLQRLTGIICRSPAVFLCLTSPQTEDPFLHTNYPDGFALYDAADIRLWVQDETWIARKGQVNGYRGTVTVIKNRLSSASRSVTLRIPFGEVKTKNPA